MTGGIEIAVHLGWLQEPNYKSLYVKILTDCSLKTSILMVGVVSRSLFSAFVR